MRARCARLDVMRSQILELELRANSLLPPSGVSPTSPPGKFRDFSRATDHRDQQPKDSASAANLVGGDRRSLSTMVEEAVIEDVEKGLRLVPLSREFEQGQASAAGLMEGRARGETAKGDHVGSDNKNSGKGSWRFLQGFWRWMRGN